MSTLIGYMLGRASVKIQQQHERVAQNMVDALTGAVDPETEIQNLRAEIARVRAIALKNKEVAEGNHASALSWRARALEAEARKEYWVGRASAAEGELEEIKCFEEARGETSDPIRAASPQDSSC
ncbi:hypothetical protein E2C06_12215 [Dankookia rubra]|uniref:PspA/IM30 family protein n=1 Tax=Dankookia rubra TaxID=1442381 RepID=A0A4R5QGY7_9PROT|nr:hypothetical protein [Dankookia rubra]TDH62366.1 hypothetical protein E2C06_12215 [Dankookia rubra]